ncbi:Homeobox-DDT domain protein RLT3 [Quillaja saponaria]|uniref:Homeobox-DDT domain protein RLT3 n=1 Tax=Quillaja saponaria TaxID=32244 RepID=A0AAD7LJE7_QUISA|nr:Homeobox-DDT domain protein RLT3 [Quillaja saponaria]
MRKTPLQRQALDNFYLEEKYPTQTAMEDYAADLGLAYKQVRDWFVEKRRREKKEKKLMVPPCYTLGKRPAILDRRNVFGVPAAIKIDKQNMSSHKAKAPLCSRYDTVVTRTVKKKEKSKCLQDLLTPDYILKKLFQKDGPPLGVEFDYLPSRTCHRQTGLRNSTSACEENQRPTKRRKFSGDAIIIQKDSNKSPVKKHGIGKGLMTVWRVTSPDAGDFPTGFGFVDREVAGLPLRSNSTSKKPLYRERKPRQKKQGKLGKAKDKKNLFLKRVVESSKNFNQKQPQKEKCELALDKAISQEQLDQISMLIDDEELELEPRELQEGADTLICSDHSAGNRMHGCALCRDLLPKFPPNLVKMKKPFSTQPWDSSPEIVKKLFKVFHFLYTYAVVLDICAFTLDEFAQAFHDKDSMLIGKIHVALLMLLLSDIEAELTNGFLPHLKKSCNFLALLHSIENQEYFLEFWKKSLNPLTWTEILCQVLVAAGFGSKQGAKRKEALCKEMNLLLKCGLRLGTLKGELFRLLSDQGNNGLKVSELAKSIQIVELNLASTTEELECLICSTLSSDVSLFKKISSSAYRLRMGYIAKDMDEFHSDTDDSGSVDNKINSGACSSDDDSGCVSGNSNLIKLKCMNRHRSKNYMLTAHTEIDESHPGEVWLLGLMEGEYSDLSIEEKLNALVALTDLLSAGTSIRMKDSTKYTAEYNSSIQYYGSGAKIKRSSAKKHSLPGLPWSKIGQMLGVKEAQSSLNSHLYPLDSSLLISRLYNNDGSIGNAKDATETEVMIDSHPIQSVFLGSDRRFNRYWLFLGPCVEDDPGHRRVYFESSEDGRWKVFDTEEALCALLSVLDDRGQREALLIESLEKKQAFLCQAMSRMTIVGIGHMTQSDQSELDTVREEIYSPVSEVDSLNLTNILKDSVPSSGAVRLEVGKKREELVRNWAHLQAFDLWVWNSFYLDLNVVKYGRRSYLDSLARCESCHDLYWKDEKHCRICHTTFELDFDLEERYAIHTATCREKDESNTLPKHNVLSTQIQSLKAAIYAIESVMPGDALVGAWRKSAHTLWVKRLRRTSSLVELFQVLADFVGAINEEWLYQCNFPQGVVVEIIASFTSMPHTSSALALWLVKLDTIIAPYLERIRPQKKQGNQ